MRINEMQGRFMGFLFGALGSVSGICCLVTGMRLEGVSLFVIALCCVITALITALLRGRKLLGMAVLGFSLAVVWSWYRGGLQVSVEALLNHISRLYDMGYSWGVIRWSEEPLTTKMAQPALCVLGVFTAMGICHSFLRCRGIWITGLLLVLPVIPCMLLVDTVPAGAWIFIQLVCLALLLMSRLSRRREQDMTLIRWLVLPVTAAVLLLFVCIPGDSYTSLKNVDKLLSYVQEFFAESGKKEPAAPTRQESGWIKLDNVGPKQQSMRVVMDVTADESGYLYLKGAAYDTYHGTWWTSTETAPAVPLPQTAAKMVTVSTQTVEDVLYLPYGAYSILNYDGFYTERNGQISNPEGWHRYTVRYRELPDGLQWGQTVSEETPKAFTQLPVATRRWATEYLARELPEWQTLAQVDLWNRAQAIVRHVSQRAAYDLKTPRMPAAGTDFARWFLEESKSGYCVHFATAATVLLRAAGVPCRYVTGYLVDARADQTVTVQQKNAHAWVECYIDGTGWIPLEPTPGGGILETVGTETTAPAEMATVPVMTEESTEQMVPDTQPEETTQGTTAAQTEPTTRPTEPTVDVGGADVQPPVNEPAGMGQVLIWLAAAAGAVTVVLGQWRLRVTLRKQKRSKGRRNAQTLVLWQEVVTHCRLRKEEPDSRLCALAQKAKFSQHTITREEQRELEDWLAGSVAELRGSSLWKRFVATVILALY